MNFRRGEPIEIRTHGTISRWECDPAGKIRVTTIIMSENPVIALESHAVYDSDDGRRLARWLTEATVRRT